MLDPMALEQILSQASPEEIEQLMGGGTLDERGGLLEQQLQLAQGLRTNNAPNHRSPIGAGLAGIGDVLNSVSSAVGTKKAQDGQQKLMADKDSLRRLFVDVLRRRQPGLGAGAGDVMGMPGAAPSPFGLG